MASPDATVPVVDAVNASEKKSSSWDKIDENDPRLQIVDENQEFTPLLHDFMKTKWGLVDRGFDYNVVAVFGSQSTGKSTLLNRLFGTSFDVMNEVQRQQTTKGIWASKSTGANLLVMDVEGTDGRERGENQDFERKSALFSLAISEVLIVNMWETMVGLYNGANMGLLKTVFEVNLQLFQKQGSPKTCLFFVIRDFTGQTPLENLSATLVKDLERIWAGLVKPAGKEAALISDFFEFAFACLPHKVYASAQFNEQTDALRKRFIDKSDPGFAFKPNYHKHIPADGFPKFAESIWEKIVTNRDLDLPTQQQLLAQFRCDEISRTVFESFSEAVKGYGSQLKAGRVLENFGSEIQEITQTALKTFDQDASRYHKEVYLTKRKEFYNKMETGLRTDYILQLTNLHKKALALFTDGLAEKLKGNEGDFAVKLRESRDEADGYFRKIAESSKLQGADWSSDEYYAQFLAQLDEMASAKKKEAIDKIILGLEKSISTALAEPISLHLNEGAPDMWRKVQNTFREAVTSAEDELRRRLNGSLTLPFLFTNPTGTEDIFDMTQPGFEFSSTDIVTQVQELKIQAWNALQKTIRQEVGDAQMAERLRARFEGVFRYDDKGLPRVWTPGDDMDGQFAKAREEADKLAIRFTKFDVPLTSLDEDITHDERFDQDSLIVISPSKLQLLRDKFRRDADLLFVEAKRSIVTTTAKVPPWMVVLACLLGWNEFVAVLSNPIMFMGLMFVGLATYITWYVGMLGPVVRGAKVVAGEGLRQTAGALKAGGVDVDGILDGTAIRNGTIKVQGRVGSLRDEEGRKEFRRYLSSPSKLGSGGEGEEVELVERKGRRRQEDDE
ncbi:Dynamin-like GTPase that mediates homotypic ER fusion [Rhizophlyctis rosea]|uniref:Dynamin-like GTPase that mediates homotypic ER fusion n=1 Tax=Rhizophlyctis rosea TaxID=64517 RepID=A0AAD5X1J6_9FUNG|nr:Dynamin-like GTPase that mediates homotypic ER fusion [Rhizophlyctis rosea]